MTVVEPVSGAGPNEVLRVPVAVMVTDFGCVCGARLGKEMSLVIWPGANSRTVCVLTTDVSLLASEMSIRPLVTARLS